MGNKQTRRYLTQYDNMADKTGVLALNVTPAAVNKLRPTSIVLTPSSYFAFIVGRKKLAQLPKVLVFQFPN